MASAIESSVEGASVELVEGGKGDFLVDVDGRVIWDKRNDQGRFPEHEEILSQLR